MDWEAADMNYGQRDPGVPFWNTVDIHTFVCEVCGRTDEVTDDKAFKIGWDYPPFMGAWGVLSPRTCPDCRMTDTAWWAIQTGQELTEKQIEFAEAVMKEVPRD